MSHSHLRAVESRPESTLCLLDCVFYSYGPVQAYADQFYSLDMGKDDVIPVLHALVFAMETRLTRLVEALELGLGKIEVVLGEGEFNWKTARVKERRSI